MIVKFYATLREITGTKEKNTKGYKTVGELLKVLVREYGNCFEKLLLQGDSLIPGAIVLVNGTHIAHLQGLDTPLSEDCTIDIFPPVAGG